MLSFALFNSFWQLQKLDAKLLCLSHQSHNSSLLQLFVGLRRPSDCYRKLSWWHRWAHQEFPTKPTLRARALGKLCTTRFNSWLFFSLLEQYWAIYLICENLSFLFSRIRIKVVFFSNSCLGLNGPSVGNVCPQCILVTISISHGEPVGPFSSVHFISNCSAWTSMTSYSWWMQRSLGTFYTWCCGSFPHPQYISLHNKVPPLGDLK